MENRPILKLAVTKAVENGYLVWPGCTYPKDWQIDFLTEDHERPNVATLIFSHDFAKAFWGEGKVDDFGYGIAKLEKPIEPDGSPAFLTARTHKAVGDNTIYTEDQVEQMELAWQYHLKQLAIIPDDERLKYIERFL